MVQPRTRLWFRQAARRIGRRGRVRAYGNRSHGAPPGTSARPASRSADRSKRQRPHGDRASRIRRIGPVAAAIVALIACSPPAPAQNAPAEVADPRAQKGLREVPLTIKSKNGVHRLTVEVAATPEQQERGLMFRNSIAADRGMIFPYEPAQEVAFWMKNTLIPLDILYIRSDGTIVRIVNAQPMDLTPLPSGEPIVGVLEIGGGRAAEMGIKEGDIASW